MNNYLHISLQKIYALSLRLDFVPIIGFSIYICVRTQSKSDNSKYYAHSERKSLDFCCSGRCWIGITFSMFLVKTTSNGQLSYQLQNSVHYCLSAQRLCLSPPHAIPVTILVDAGPWSPKELASISPVVRLRFLI